MNERVLNRIVIVLAAAVVGVVVFSLVLVLAPEAAPTINESPQRTPTPMVAGLVAALVAAAGVLAMPLLLDFLSVRRPEPVARQQPDPRVGPLLDQRAALVRGLVDLLPQLPDGLVWQAENTLAQVGVRPVVPDGEVVDPLRHHVVGTEPPADATQANTVARTIRPGYADGERLVIHPKVVVYAMDQAP